MNTQLIKGLYIISALVGMCALAYGAYILYDIIMIDVTNRIKIAIAEGIQEGIVNTANPLNWPQALIRHLQQ